MTPTLTAAVERKPCSYCGAPSEPGHYCERSPNATEAARRLQGQLAWSDLSDPYDYDLSLIVAALTTQTAILREAAEALEPYVAHDGKRMALLNAERDLTMSDGEWAFHMKVEDHRRAVRVLAKIRDPKTDANPT